MRIFTLILDCSSIDIPSVGKFDLGRLTPLLETNPSPGSNVLDATSEIDFASRDWNRPKKP
jgi:hypothetical protein